MNHCKIALNVGRLPEYRLTSVFSRAAGKGMIVIVGVAITACHRAEPPKVAPPMEVGVAIVKAQPLRETTDLPGRTSAYLVSQVRARVDGIVLKRSFREGSDVKINQLLFKIDPAPYQATLAGAKAAQLKAEANAESTAALAQRDKILVEENAVSRQEYDNAVAAAKQAVADVAAARAQVLTADINLGYTAVTAPVSGRIGLAQVTEGAYVQAASATLMATVQQTDPTYVDLAETSVAGLQLRSKVASGQIKLDGPDQTMITLKLEDGSTYPLIGKLQFTDITVDQGTGSVTVRAIFPNPNHLLLPGMFVRAQIDEGVNPNGLLVPQVAVTHDQKGQPTVLVVGADNKVALKTLVTGSVMGANWVVLSGLKANDRVIVEGLQKVQIGQVVKPMMSTTPQGSSASAGTVTGPAKPKNASATTAPPKPPEPAH